MGMSASQARLLNLTARLSDLEYSAQSISNSKIRLACQSEEASKEYCEALDKQKLTVYSGVDSTGNAVNIDATAYNLTTYNAVSETDKQRFLKDQSGRVLVNSKVSGAYTSSAGNLSSFLSSYGLETNESASGYDSGAISFYTNVFNEIKENGFNEIPDADMQNVDWLYAQLSSGNIFLSEFDKEEGENGEGDFVDVSWSSGDTTLNEVDDTTALARAEAKYQATIAGIEAKDKRFDLELKTIDTEHTAIQTEVASVKKVIDKNIERSFKVFDA